MDKVSDEQSEPSQLTVGSNDLDKGYQPKQREKRRGKSAEGKAQREKRRGKSAEVLRKQGDSRGWERPRKRRKDQDSGRERMQRGRITRTRRRKTREIRIKNRSKSKPCQPIRGASTHRNKSKRKVGESASQRYAK
jgi:hypothetical protein